MMRQCLPRMLPVCVGLLLSGCFLKNHKPDTPSLVPAQTVGMDEETLAKFQREIEEYVQLRTKALTHITPVTAQSTPEELTAHQRALTQAIVAYRKGEKPGNMFKPSVAAAIRRTLQREFSGPNGPAMMKEIKSGNPKVEGNPNPKDPSKETKQPVTIAVNAVYPDAAPFSSVPSTLLLKLPPLPEEVRYRFVGRALILRDTQANVILDYLMDVVPDPSIPR